MTKGCQRIEGRHSFLFEKNILQNKHTLALLILHALPIPLSGSRQKKGCH